MNSVAVAGESVIGEVVGVGTLQAYSPVIVINYAVLYCVLI